jgi:beta-lactam-binding protein with PASTA domain
MTETGSVMGTAQYLSPEQAQGKPVDARSDLYSTGIVLYELLTGRVPFDAESPVSVALMQVSEPPVPPMEVNPEVPPALDAVTLRAMEKDPGRRYQDADEFIAALESARKAPMEILPPPPVVVEEVVEEEPGRRWWPWVIALLALLAIGIGLYLLLRPEQLTVPSVVGLRSATASQILKDRGFEVEVVNVANPDVERDQVAAQDPRPNTEAPEGSVVEITVSTGPGEAPVPTVAGLPRKEAEAELRDAGFEPRVEKAFSDTVPKGRVIETTPPGGTTIDRGSTVILQVSRGREQAEVPDVVGQSEANARSEIEGAGLRVGKVTEKASEEESGTVIEQTPAAGESVDRGEAVDLVVARGVPVPDVVDSTEEEATATLEDAGFEVRVREQTVTDPAQDGVVLEQSPAADEERRQGSRVTIVVGRAEAAATPTPTPTATP